MNTVPELIDAFGGPTAFSAVIGKGASTASEMKRSGRIQPKYWPKIIDAAEARNIEGVSYQTLALMHAEPAEAS